MKNKIFSMYSRFYRLILSEGIEKACETAVRLGFSAVETFSSTEENVRNAIPDVVAARHAKTVLDQYKLPVVCHSVFANIWNNDKAEKQLMEQVDIAKELGSPYLHHTLLSWLGLPADAPEYTEAIKAAVNVATHVAGYAETLGITCIYEEQGYYLNGVEGFKGFYDEMKKRCKNIGICGDLGNCLFVNELPEKFLAAYIEDIRHIHVKDYLVKKAAISPGIYWNSGKDNTWLRNTMVGSGVVDFEACLKILDEAGYQGAFSLETESPEPFEDGVRQAMQYLSRF